MSQPKFQALSHTRHADQAWTRATSWHFARFFGLVPVAAMELPQALPHLPLAFIENAQKGFSLIALLGVKSDQSLAVDTQGNFLPGYVPGLLRTQPFRLMHNPSTQDRVVTIDSQHLVPKGRPDSLPLFEDDGEPSEDVTKAVAFLKRLAVSLSLTDKAATALAKHGVLEPWNPIIQLPDNACKLQGLYRVNTSALQALEPEQLKAVQQAAGLDIAYAQLYSMAQIQQLQAWANIQGTQSSTVDLDNVFGNQTDDTLKFNFDI